MFIEYQKIKSDAECLSDDEKLGTFPTVYDCFNACLVTTGCTYFIYGKEQGGAKDQCYWEKTTNENCPEGWEEDKKFDFYKLGTLLYK